MDHARKGRAPAPPDLSVRSAAADRIDDVRGPRRPAARFRWRRTVHDVAHSEGPERIAGEWWRRQDIPTRDYYRIEDRRGRRFWIFRHGLYSEVETPRWYLHGLFA